MNSLVNYLLESGISLSLFALSFLLFLRKETFFRTNRLFLLFGYRKNECDDLTQAQIKSLAEIIERL